MRRRVRARGRIKLINAIVMPRVLRKKLKIDVKDNHEKDQVGIEPLTGTHATLWPTLTVLPLLHCSSGNKLFTLGYSILLITSSQCKK